MNASWWPSVVGGGLSFFGFSLVWYRLSRLERQLVALEDVSLYDHQTGLRSGRLFESECAILCRSSSAVAVLLVDLDNFRRFNEGGYREEGDRALCLAARVLQESLRRTSDRIYRLYTAGDEFVIFLSVTDERQACWHAERLRRALERAEVPASVGIAFAPSSDQQREPGSLLKEASDQKNKAKERGGNSVSPPLDSPPAVPSSVEWEKTEKIDRGNLVEVPS